MRVSSSRGFKSLCLLLMIQSSYFAYSQGPSPSCSGEQRPVSPQTRSNLTDIDHGICGAIFREPPTVPDPQNPSRRIANPRYIAPSDRARSNPGLLTDGGTPSSGTMMELARQEVRNRAQCVTNMTRGIYRQMGHFFQGLGTLASMTARSCTAQRILSNPMVGGVLSAFYPSSTCTTAFEHRLMEAYGSYDNNGSPARGYEMLLRELTSCSASGVSFSAVGSCENSAFFINLKGDVDRMHSALVRQLENELEGFSCLNADAKLRKACEVAGGAVFEIGTLVLGGEAASLIARTTARAARRGAQVVTRELGELAARIRTTRGATAAGSATGAGETGGRTAGAVADASHAPPPAGIRADTPAAGARPPNNAPSPETPPRSEPPPARAQAPALSLEQRQARVAAECDRRVAAEIASVQSQTTAQRTAAVLREHDLTEDTVVYRWMDRRFLNEAEGTVAGNPNSMAMITDEYARPELKNMARLMRNTSRPGAAAGDVEIAEQYLAQPGNSLTNPPTRNASSLSDPGINVSRRPLDGYSGAHRGDSNMVLVQVRVGDAVRAGGRVYADISSTGQGAFYLTIPRGHSIPYRLVTRP